jgi:hypothetical protein
MSRGVFASFVASIGVAIIITALVLPNRQTPAVIKAVSSGGVNLTEAALGQRGA